MSQEIETHYSVGIDLGTTHCVLSYLDNLKAAEDTTTALDILVLPIPQLTQPGLVEERKQLPSFIYSAHDSELSPSELTLPWPSEAKALTGVIARQLGSTKAEPADVLFYKS